MENIYSFEKKIDKTGKDSKLFINLDSLLDLSNKLNKSRDIEFILNTALLSLMGKLGFFRASAFIGNRGSLEFKTIITKGNFDVSKVLLLREYLKNFFIKTDKIILVAEPKHLILYITYGIEPFALLFLESKAFSIDYTQEEFHYINIVANLIASALENALSYQTLLNSKIELERKNQILSTIYDLTKDFSSLLNQDQVVSHLRYRIFGQLAVNKFALFYKYSDSFEEVYNNTSLSLEDELFEILFNLKKVTLFEEIENLSEWARLKFFSANLSLACPIKVQEQTKGLLIVGKKFHNSQFTDDDLLFIELLGNTLGQFFENIRLIDEEIKRKQIERELELAKTIQQKLLPNNFKEFNQIDVFGTSIPSKVVGGDYFDFIPIDDKSFYFAVADVSGKGIPASLLMANVQASLRVLSKLNLTLSEIVNRINQLVLANTEPDKFVTFFLGKIDLAAKQLEYINAGHHPPILVRDGNIYFLSKGGLLLGSFESPIDFEVENIGLKQGDFIFGYTDGTIECRSPKNEEFGIDRLIDFVKKFSILDSKIFCKQLISTLSLFTKSIEFSDDVTIIAIKVK